VSHQNEIVPFVSQPKRRHILVAHIAEEFDPTNLGRGTAPFCGRDFPSDVLTECQNVIGLSMADTLEEFSQSV
jgi:hypothetical protein